MEVANFIIGTFPPPSMTRNPALIRPTLPRNNRMRRRMEYASTQRNWQKHQGRCIKQILQGEERSIFPEEYDMTNFWKEIMTRHTNISPGIDHNLAQQLDQLWTPLTPSQIEKSWSSASTSPGPDGIRTEQLEALGKTCLTYLYNLVLWTADSPGQFRPITISSLIIRHINVILAFRLRESIKLDTRQRRMDVRTTLH